MIFFILPHSIKKQSVSFTYNKKEKLKSKKLIDQMFVQGKSVSAYPLRLVYMPTTFNTNNIAKTGVSVSKRNFKTAVDRNRIKRLLREAYRLNKLEYFNNLSIQHAFMILYIGKEKPTLNQLQHKMTVLFNKFKDKTLHDKN